MAEFIDMTGKTIGNLTVISRIVNDSERGGARWLCKCNECNRLIATRSDKLNSSKYEDCTHGETLEIPNVGKVLKSVSSDFYLVDCIGSLRIIIWRKNAGLQGKSESRLLFRVFPATV